MRRKPCIQSGAFIIATVFVLTCTGVQTRLTAAEQNESSMDSVTLSVDGRTQFVIVTSSSPSAEEATAAEWLAESLQQVTGAMFPIVKDGSSELPASRIHIVADPELRPEEWRIRTHEGTLWLSGGAPRGTIYAICEFLESHVGLFRFDVFTEHIPDKPTLIIQAADRRGCPAFKHRYLFTGFPYAHPAPVGSNGQRWRVWNKEHSYAGPATGDYPRIVPDGVHTFGRFLAVKEFAASHPEYFSMDAEGRRMTDDHGQPSCWVQLCVTNDDVRRITLERARQMLRDDLADAERTGRTPAQLLVLSQNDNTVNLCLCPVCRSFADREGSESGPLIDFVNSVADGLKAEFPDVVVQTEAYNFTLKPPLSVRPAAGVMVRYCDNYGLSDMTRPLSDPRNADRLTLLDGWAKGAGHLAVWDYWRTIEDHPPGMLAPSSNVRAMVRDIRLFKERGVSFVTVEVEDFMGAGLNSEWMSYDLQSFIPLRVWLGMKLLDDPSKDPEELLTVFCSGYYGASAVPMRALLNLIEDRQELVAVNSSARRRHVWIEALCDAAFFSTAMQLLEAAELAAGVDRRLLTRIHRERIVIDSAYLWSEGAVRRKAPDNVSALPERMTVLQRHRADWKEYVCSAFDETGQAVILPFVETGLRLIEKLSARDTDSFREAISADETTVVLDGRLDETVWQQAEPLRLLPRDPAAPNEDQSAFRFVWTADAMIVGVDQPSKNSSAIWEVSLMAPDRKGVQLALHARPDGSTAAYFYRYPEEGGMVSVSDRKSLSRVVSADAGDRVTAEIQIPWSDISATAVTGDTFLLNIGVFPELSSKAAAFVSSPWLIGSAPTYNPAYHGTIGLGSAGHQ